MKPLERRRKGNAMHRVDAYYLYSVATQIHPLAELKLNWSEKPKKLTTGDVMSACYVAESALTGLVERSDFKLRTCRDAADALIIAARMFRHRHYKDTHEDAEDPEPTEVLDLQAKVRTFETIFAAELALYPVYVVKQKGGFDTAVLVERGWKCFPASIWVKAPSAIPDLKEGAKCLAFEVYTAAAFHLHRANESILRRYWDKVTSSTPHPSTPNIGVYLREMDRLGVGDSITKSALRDLKDQHRNPLIHPDHSIKDADEAIALMNGVHNSVTRMLIEIPEIEPRPPIPNDDGEFRSGVFDDDIPF